MASIKKLSLLIKIKRAMKILTASYHVSLVAMFEKWQNHISLNEKYQPVGKGKFQKKILCCGELLLLLPIFPQLPVATSNLFQNNLHNSKIMTIIQLQFSNNDSPVRNDINTVRISCAASPFRNS